MCYTNSVDAHLFGPCGERWALKHWWEAGVGLSILQLKFSELSDLAHAQALTFCGLVA